MNQYTLYLDESETFTKKGDRFFAIGGVIINQVQEGKVESDLNVLKNGLWDGNPNAQQFILHEKEITEVQRNGRTSNKQYNIFRQKSISNHLYTGLSRILKQNNIETMCVCLDKSELSKLYPGEVNDNLTIAIQMLFENYCHFLIKNNANGCICYESLQEPGNQPLRQRFYELAALGTMYYTSHCFQTHISGIDFQSKNENVAGLQLADFIPNTFARKCAKLNPKHKSFKDTVLKNAYDGGMKLERKYGLKLIP